MHIIIIKKKKADRVPIKDSEMQSYAYNENYQRKYYSASFN